MKKNYVILTFCLLMTCTVFSQTQKNFCGFDFARAEKMKDPVFAKQAQLFEKQLQKKIKQSLLNKKTEDVLTIPVVFHVFHGGEALGTGLNIADSEIQRMLDAINDFYRGRTAGNSLDFNIEFKLAIRNENCSTTSGIVRADASGVPNYLSKGLSFEDGDGGASLTDLIDLTGKWDGKLYFNMLGINNYASVAVGTGIFFNPDSGVGNITIPVGAIAADNWRLYIHEIGHYLNLHHTFEGDKGGDPDAEPIVCTNGDGDFCDDTEPHTRKNSDAPLTTNVCSGQPWLNDNTTKNHMSYFNNTTLMTNDQKLRVRALLEGSKLANSPGLVAPPANWATPTAVCIPNVATRISDQVGIASVEINGTKIETGAAFTDDVKYGGNIDLANNCNQLFNIDGTSAYNMEVNFPENAPSSFLHQLGVWIDWNNDGDFDDDNEQQYLQDNLDPGSPVQVSIVYPSNVTYDSHVRIRLIADIRSNWSAYGDIDSACFSPREGQSEDYTIYIEPKTLSIKDFGFENINIFSDNKNKQIQIEGNLDTPTKVFLYDIQGRVLVSKKMNLNASKNFINTSSLSSGIYVVKINSGRKIKSKKIIIN